jgi:hypothetical protein
MPSLIIVDLEFSNGVFVHIGSLFSCMHGLSLELDTIHTNMKGFLTRFRN